VIDRLGFGITHLVRRILRPPRYLGKGFRFLHVSSGFPRKGVDVLLKAYTREFTSKDPVTLVIKTFPNPHNQVDDLIRRCRAENGDFPEIVQINEDLSGENLQDLYRQCHAFVAPSRGEGFGLPMAEAMAVGIPVITTGAGGQVDFCTEETSWLIDYRWELAQTHMGLSDSVWAEPDADHLAHLMREIYQGPREKYQAKLERARLLVQTQNSWTRCATRVIETVRRIEKQKPLIPKKIKLCWVSPWNTSSEIFEYSKSWIELLSRFDDVYELRILASTLERFFSVDGEKVLRCWDEQGDLSGLKTAIERGGFDVIVVQFHPALFQVAALGEYLQSLNGLGTSIILFLHGIDDSGKPEVISFASIRSQLAHCQRILVSRIADLNLLKGWGLVENVTLFPPEIPPHLELHAKLALARRLHGMIRALVSEARLEKG
jgi:hypothetical protein